MAVEIRGRLRAGEVGECGEDVGEPIGGAVFRAGAGGAGPAGDGGDSDAAFGEVALEAVEGAVGVEELGVVAAFFVVAVVAGGWAVAVVFVS